MSTKQIREDFRMKGDDYYRRNYSGNNNPLRSARMEILYNIFSSVDIASRDVLDAGAGPAVLYEMITRFGGGYFASDISIDNILAAQKRIGDFNGVVADTCRLPFAGECFDVAASIGSLEYIPDTESAIAELGRVLKPGGYLILSFANSSSPARQWDESVIRGIRKLRGTLSGKKSYPRFLMKMSKAKEMLDRNSMDVHSVHYYNAGIFGYPFRKLSLLNTLQQKITDGNVFFKKRSLEYIIVARKRS